MDAHIKVEMNEKLYNRNPERSNTGKRILEHSIKLIDQLGFEGFTFRKLADRIGTSEATIYRYFENKHKLLIYIVAWYWSWLEYQVLFHTHNLEEPQEKLRQTIHILSSPIEYDPAFPYIDESTLHHIVIAEASKAYLTKHVSKDNRDGFFKPYKELCNRIAQIILDNNPHYPHPIALSSSMIEVAHLQNYFALHIPSVTDIEVNNNNHSQIIAYIENLVFSCIGKNGKV